MSKILGSIFGFGDKMKRRLRDAASNPRDYLEMTADENQNEWKKNPEERAMGFFNPVPLGKVDPFMLRSQMKEAIEEITNMSRRSFMKKSAGLAAGSTVGAGVTAKLLRKFAPEEKQVLKEGVDTVAQTIKELPKHKYNSLKEYLDDVQEGVSSSAGPRGWQTTEGGFGTYDDLVKERLLQDELAYNNAKWAEQNAAKYPHEYQPRDRETLNMLSPQAKKEMKFLKDKTISLDRAYGGTEPEHEVWTSWLANSKGDIDSTLKALQELP